jgi:hypothetical protein
LLQLRNPAILLRLEGGMIRYARTLAFGTALAAAAGVAIGAPGQPQTGPVAVYWMSVSTTTGMGGMMGGAGQRPNMMQMMQHPDAVSHQLTLQLGSERHPDGDPTAEHDPPTGLDVGPMLPLVTPQATAPVHEEQAPGPPPQYQQPHGRMLIFWGCGEHAGPNQPYVIDFASMGTQAGAAQFGQMMRSLDIQAMQPPAPGRNTTYGEWPNQRSTVSVPAGGSLIGDHTVRGDYTPDIHFSLAQGQDFMPGFQMTANQRNPSGSATLGWQPMDQARGFFAGMFGAAGQDQVVMWTSSEVQSLAFGIPEYLSDGEINRLVGSHVLMPPSQTQCTIPEEAIQAAGHSGFFTLTAYGGEANFAYPDRPPPPRPWHVDWAVKVRYRSSTSGIVGMNMSQMMGGDDEDRPQDQQTQQQQQQQQQQRPRPGIGSFIPGLGGFIP